jgi:prepilin-type N-terminal cleavage/methylation domain-containing protein
MRQRTKREGFSIVELLVSLLVLSVAVLALATALGYMVLQLRSADTRTERAVAVEQVQEQLLGMDFDDVDTIPETQADTVGSYALWWQVRSSSSTIKRIVIYSRGPGIDTAGLNMAMEDSSSVTLANVR